MSNLYKHGWKVHRPLLQIEKYMKLLPDDFEEKAVVTFVTE